MFHSRSLTRKKEGEGEEEGVISFESWKGKGDVLSAVEIKAPANIRELMVCA